MPCRGLQKVWDRRGIDAFSCKEVLEVQANVKGISAEVQVPSAILLAMWAMQPSLCPIPFRNSLLPK
jgi:hypothetical protein